MAAAAGPLCARPWSGGADTPPFPRWGRGGGGGGASTHSGGSDALCREMTLAQSSAFTGLDPGLGKRHPPPCRALLASQTAPGTRLGRDSEARALSDPRAHGKAPGGEPRQSVVKTRNIERKRPRAARYSPGAGQRAGQQRVHGCPSLPSCCRCRLHDPGRRWPAGWAGSYGTVCTLFGIGSFQKKIRPAQRRADPARPGTAAEEPLADSEICPGSSKDSEVTVRFNGQHRPPAAVLGPGPDSGTGEQGRLRLRPGTAGARTPRRESQRPGRDTWKRKRTPAEPETH